MKLPDKVVAGALIFLGSAGSITGIIVSEALSPGYHSSQMISDLGIGPAAPVFNASLALCGILVMAAAYCLWKEGFDLRFCALMALIGLGQAGVGFFPENTGAPHLVSAAIVFLGGCLLAFLSARVFSVPWAWISCAIGIVTLVAISLFINGNYLGLGVGGMERIIAYPLLFWALGSGALLMTPK